MFMHVVWGVGQSVETIKTTIETAQACSHPLEDEQGNQAFGRESSCSTADTFRRMYRHHANIGNSPELVGRLD